ncbi:family 4 glycosyl hydrolase [Algisphaera agarilytica]|uniref:Alpha-galactosidase n=1 Tax=Algisphaera agarilytica TaxID=1385975 RepID=A0A7X0H4H6_9BACT|nr:alpha-glucosidase/alpha-galactosidase [Algisphaera agarilytica]MBB6429143.1 alpha-galactosidase [Algisphaera agarilytica]
MPASLDTPVISEVDDDAKGHDAHTKAAESTTPLPGRIDRPINVVFLGAGSTFCPKICRDILTIESADRGELRLVDIDADRLALTTQVVEKIISDLGKQGGWSVQSTTDRRAVLPGAHYAVCSVEVSGLDCVAWDNDIPLKYGVDQCIGDTIGPGGLFKGLRTVPVFLDILRDMRELCPGAVMLNYTNPMNMMVLAAGRAIPEVPVVGLCHSVQGTSHLLADLAEVPYDELDWECAGINHLAWFTKLEHRGRDLYESRLFEQFRRDLEAGIAEAEAGKASFDNRGDSNGETAEKQYEFEELIRKDMCVHFGAFITESSGHLSEYLPYYRKSEEGKKLLRLGYHGGSRFYASNWPSWRKHMDEQRNRWVTGEEAFDLNRSWEYGSWIIEAMEKNAPLRIHGNVMNHATALGKTSRGEAGKLITNLPGDGCVEVACYVDKNGIQPTRYGSLPPQMAHICASNMAMFDLAAQSIIHRSKQAAAHALMLDPLCAAVLTPREIEMMTMEMFDAEREFLPEYS